MRETGRISHKNKNILVQEEKIKQIQGVIQKKYGVIWKTDKSELGV